MVPHGQPASYTELETLKVVQEHAGVIPGSLNENSDAREVGLQTHRHIAGRNFQGMRETQTTRQPASD